MTSVFSWQSSWQNLAKLGDRSKVQCCKEQYCIGTWNVRSMNQGKLEVVKQEMARVNVDILGISKLKLAFALLHSVLQGQICLLL